MTDKERYRQECLDISPLGLYGLEKNLLDYFVKNEKLILRIQQHYQERNQNMDILTATEYSLRKDLNSTRTKQRHRVHNLVNALQYAIAVKIARQKSHDGQAGDNEIIRELKGVSGIVRPKQIEYMGFLEYIMEDYSKPIFKKIFEEKINNAA